MGCERVMPGNGLRSAALQSGTPRAGAKPGAAEILYEVEVRGFDYFNTRTEVIESGNT